LPDEPRYNSMRAKAKWLQGVLYWQLQADYKTRLRDVDKRLAELEPQVEETLHRHRQIDAALKNVKAGFDGYNERIEALRTRILELLPRIAAARGQSSQHLQQLALEELVTRKQRLFSYRSQARYALARSYDQLARTPGEQP
jgi:chromosome segregation ATPase